MPGCSHEPQPLTQTVKILTHKDEMVKLKDINNAAALRRTLNLDLSGYFAKDSIIFFFIIEVRQKWAKCYTHVSCRSSKGEREETKEAAVSPSLLPSCATRRKGIQQAAPSHPRRWRQSASSQAYRYSQHIYIRVGFFFPLKVQLLAYRNSNNHIFFPSHGEEMQTTSLQVEEKNRLCSSSNNPVAGG